MFTCFLFLAGMGFHTKNEVRMSRRCFSCLFHFFFWCVSEIKLKKMWPLFFDIVCKSDEWSSNLFFFTAHWYQGYRLWCSSKQALDNKWNKILMFPWYTPQKRPRLILCMPLTLIYPRKHCCIVQLPTLNILNFHTWGLPDKTSLFFHSSQSSTTAAVSSFIKGDLMDFICEIGKSRAAVVASFMLSLMNAAAEGPKL